ncbi:MAG: 50S ribosomal protein L11 methyltransferase [Pseudomonadota bacterium]
MLQFEIETPLGLTGDLAVRIMSIWPNLEIAPEENRVVFHLPVDERLDVNISLLEEALQAFERARNLDELNIVTRNLTGPDAGPDRIEAGRFLILRPGRPVGRLDAGREILFLESNAAFGAGGHPSTRLMLKALEDFFSSPPGAPSREGARVLDAGTGSGILSLAAARLGAGPIRAVDIATEAVEAAARNLALNRLTDRVEVEKLPADQAEGEYDLILANMTPSVLLRTVKKLVGFLAPPGVLILAGFADSQASQVVGALTKSAMVTQKSYSNSGWSALLMVRS